MYQNIGEPHGSLGVPMSQSLGTSLPQVNKLLAPTGARPMSQQMFQQVQPDFMQGYAAAAAAAAAAGFGGQDAAAAMMGASPFWANAFHGATVGYPAQFLPAMMPGQPFMANATAFSHMPVPAVSSVAKISNAATVQPDSEPKKKYVCKHANCNRSFDQKNNLARHVRSVHEKMRRYSCPNKNCDKKFAEKNTLTIHICAVHGSETSEEELRTLGVKNRFKCTVDGCNRFFSIKSRLQKHVQTQHKNQSEGKTESS